MIGALNQNNILEIIKSEISDIFDIINDIMIKSISDINYNLAKKNLNDFKSLTSIVFSRDGILNQMYNNIDAISMSSILKTPILIKTLKYYISEMIKIMSFISDNSKKLDLNYLSDLLDILKNLNNINNNTNTYNSLLVILIKHLELINYISNISVDKNVYKNLDDLNLVTIGIIDFIKQFENINYKTLSLLFLSITLLKGIMFEYFYILTAIDEFNIGDKMISKINDLNIFTSSIIEFIKQFEKIKTKNILDLFLFEKIFKSKIIIKALENINEIVLYLSGAKNVNSNSIKNKIDSINIVVSSLKNILTKLLILTPLFVLVALAAPIIIMGLMVVKVLIFFIVNMMKFTLNKNAQKHITILTTITTLLVIIALNMLALAAITVLILYMWKPLLLFFVLLTVVLISIILISKIIVSPKSLLSIILMGIAVGLILIIASEILILAGISGIIVSQAGNIFLFLLVLAGIAISIAILGIGLVWALPFILTATLALIPLTIAIISIVAIASMLLLLKNIRFSEDDLETIQSNVRNIIDASLLVIACIFYGSDIDKNGQKKNNESDKLRNDSWFMRIIKGIGFGSGLVIQALASAALLVPLIIATFSILLIAGILWILGKINFTDKDKANIKNNVHVVISTAFDVINSIFGIDSSDTENKPENRNWFSNLITYVLGGLTNIIGMIMAIGFLALSIVSIGMILLLAGQLKILEKIELNYGLVRTNIKNVIDCAMSVISAIFETDKKTDDKPSDKNWIESAISWIGDKVGGVFNGIKNITGMLMSVGFLALSLIAIGMVYVLAKQLTYISEIKFTPADVIKKINLITSTSNTVIDLISGKNVTDNYAEKIKKIHDNVSKSTGILKVLKSMVDTMNSMNHISDKDVENNTKLVGNYVNLIEKTNTIKVENVKTMTDMFKAMSEFSNSINGNFDELAETLANKIAPLLAELRDIMSKMPTDFNASIKTSSETISKTIVNTSGNPANWTQDSIKQASNVSTDKAEQERIKSEQIQKAKEAKAEQERISSILQDILDIMSGQGSHPEGVKTC